MKTFIAIIFSAAVFITTESLTPEQKEQLMSVHNECAAVTGISDEIARKGLDGEFPNDQKFKEHVFCFAKKLGCQNDAGEIQPDHVREMLNSNAVEGAVVDQIMSKCIVQKATPEETAYEFIKCMHDIKHP